MTREQQCPICFGSGKDENTDGPCVCCHGEGTLTAFQCWTGKFVLPDDAETVTVRGVAIGDVTLGYQGFDEVDRNYYFDELSTEYADWLAENGDWAAMAAEELVAEMEAGLVSHTREQLEWVRDFSDRWEQLARMVREQFADKELNRNV